MTSTPERPSSDWMGRNRPLIAYALFGLGGLFAVLALVLVLRYRLDYLAEVFFAAITALAAVAAGMHLMTREPGPMREEDVNRLFALVCGGFLGLVLTLYGLCLMIRWSDTLLGGTEKWQSEEGWRVWISAAIFLFGLGILFVSLLAARTEELSNPTLRRLVYGYNAVLSGLLVLAILVVVNILGYLYLPATSDWTSANIYTLSSESKGVLQGLDKPVSIHVLEGGRQTVVSNDVRNLLENFQAESSKVQVEYISVHRQLDRAGQLIEKYQLVENSGVLLVYGTAPNTQHQFIRDEELVERRMSRNPEEAPYTFKGEDAIVSALKYLAEGKSKPVIYFTQGNGELDLEDTETTRPDRGLSALRGRLEKANHEAKGLQLSVVNVGKKEDPRMVVASKVPDDAAAVVIAGPRNPFPAETLAALTEYMNRVDPETKAKKGKLIILLDVVMNREGALVQTGLEKWLAEYNVEVGNNRVLCAQLTQRSRRHNHILVTPNPRLRGNPVATVLEGQIFSLEDVRSIRPRMPAGSDAKPSPYRAEELLVSVVPGTWAEPNVRAEPTQLVRDLIENRPEELRERIQGRVPVAVAVSESGELPDIREHRGLQSPDAKPRLVVFGDATLACNAMMHEGGDSDNYDLFASSLAWLRERPQNIGITAKKRDMYKMDQGTNLSRLVWLPLILMMASVIGFGAGVWVVRRR